LSPLERRTDNTLEPWRRRADIKLEEKQMTFKSHRKEDSRSMEDNIRKPNKATKIIWAANRLDLERKVVPGHLERCTREMKTL
jgi:hypothetical protein